ncbi:MAG: cell division protein ZapE [Pseudomonadota bacterium]
MTGRTSVVSRYEAKVAVGELQRDDAQLAVLKKLDALQDEFEAQSAQALSFLGRLFGKSRTEDPIRGLYIWGGVGRGKTMLMDLFYESLDTRKKRRVHFHAFMSDVHDRIAAARKRDPGDPLPIVADEISDNAAILCFDELHVTDIADAMILGRLFRRMFERGVIVVATSNVEPDDLYRNGLNRDLFLPFIALIEQHMEVHHFAAGTDYRLQKLAGRKLYFDASDEAERGQMDDVWADFTEGEREEAIEVSSLGRLIPVSRAVGGAARFSFNELCGRPLGSRDYLAIARRFHTVFLDGVPVLGSEKRNEARRLINLVDTLYDMRTCLVVSADAEPKALYVAGDGSDHFARTASRLIDMRSEAYLADRDARIAALQAAGEEKAGA